MPADPARGRWWADRRRTCETTAWNYGTCSPWRDLPAERGPLCSVECCGVSRNGLNQDGGFLCHFTVPVEIAASESSSGETSTCKNYSFLGSSHAQGTERERPSRMRMPGRPSKPSS
ncbi:hypothetical protein FNH09_07360 [Streptomyces adustus]|uniref:Uncharacterized protein n=1 Tax=Streptomyces adustus TaxID=1609272 RepID=A0A5N8V920_9ACTN|nr:hypothetical protein [Streptomyces adustus]